MTKINRNAALFAIILLEGYVVLSSELLAIRLTIPFIGGGTDTVSVIIAAVLMPLAFGYFNGGRYSERVKNKPLRERSIRRRLILNMLISALFLLPGLSYFFLTMTLGQLMTMGFDSRLTITTLYSLIFLVTPVYLLGQTIPLIMHYFSTEQSARITGRVLCLSTLGSFLGAIFCTLVLMATIGVHHAAAINLVLLAVMATVLSRKKLNETVFAMWLIAIVALGINSEYAMGKLNIVSNNQYNTTAVYVTDEGVRHLIQNNNDSSMFSDYGQKHAYVEFLERVAIDPIRDTTVPKEILVIGTGGFTFGKGDIVNHYTYLDIDPVLKDIAEKYILLQPLEENKKFIATEARAFLASDKTKYDMILLDTYYGRLSVPEHLVTQNFLQQIRDHMKPEGMVLFNFILSQNFASPISRNMDNTLRAVFPNVSRHVINEDYDLWGQNDKALGNVMYLYRDHGDIGQAKIYTDNKNTVYYDMP